MKLFCLCFTYLVLTVFFALLSAPLFRTDLFVNVAFAHLLKPRVFQCPRPWAEYLLYIADLLILKVAFNRQTSKACIFLVKHCQCFFYFDHTRLAPKLFRILKPEGKLAIIYMAWLPFEDKIAGASEQLVLRYHPDWTGGGEIRHPIEVDSCYKRFFTCENECVFDVSVPFTRESWAGRIRACRGIGASLSPEQVQEFDSEHRQLLRDIAPEQFSILHYCAVTVLKKRSFVNFSSEP